MTMMNFNYSTLTYADLERKQATPFRRRTIDGSITGSNKCVGYCLFDDHPGYLTEKQRHNHNCLANNCYHYIAKEKSTEPRFFNITMQSALASALKNTNLENCIQFSRAD